MPRTIFDFYFDFLISYFKVSELFFMHNAIANLISIITSFWKNGHCPFYRDCGAGGAKDEAKNFPFVIDRIAVNYDQCKRNFSDKTLIYASSGTCKSIKKQ